ncbi:MAG TPA: GNAT family N-acetyltransferase [Thermomicrobiales bacterium]
MDGRYRFELLARHHNRSAFSCGTEELDLYLRQHAGQDARRYVAAIHVLYDPTADLIAGFYTLNAASIEPGAVRSIILGLPRYPSLPAILLGRLAVDNSYRGQGLGELLLLNALRRSLAITEQVAAVAVIVDAKNDNARGFYRHFGFQSMADDADRFILSMANIDRTYGPRRSVNP